MSGSAAGQTPQQPRYATMKKGNRINVVSKPPFLVGLFMLIPITDQSLQNLVKNAGGAATAESRLVGPFGTGELIKMLLGHNRPVGP